MSAAKDCIDKGKVLLKQGQYDEALACFDQAIAKEPQNPNAWAAKCIALMTLMRAQEALACAEKVQEFGDPVAAAELVAACREMVRTEQSYNKGLELHQLGRLDEEIACYEQVLQVEPQHEKAWHNKGVALLMLMRLEEALPCLEQAHKLGHPQSLQAIEITRKYLAEKAASRET
jgi:tetratricopeptide (TPR) repeat protein